MVSEVEYRFQRKEHRTFMLIKDEFNLDRGQSYELTFNLNQ